MMIPILFEDEEVVAINKPSGITVNKSETTQHEETVQNWVEEYLKVSKGDSSFDTFLARAGIVHRLDKETSGVLLIAKNEQAFIELQRQFKERIIKKTYLAVAHGIITPPEGEIRVPIGRLPWSRKQFGVVSGGREAVTRYKTLRYIDTKILRNEKLTLVQLYPETGRTHQIRVHLKYIGHPIFGDFLYAGRKTARQDRKILARVFLHAEKIMFLHPTSQKEVWVEAPLSAELQQILQ